MKATPDLALTNQTYALRGKTAYFLPGQAFKGGITFLAGAPSSLANLPSYLNLKYKPLDDLNSPHAVTRYAAIKALPYRDDLKDQALLSLEKRLSEETDPRVALEAAGSAVSLGSNLGQERIAHFIWEIENNPE